MIASLKGYGRIARAVLAVIGGLLIAGILGSLYMSYRATEQAEQQVATQAATLADSSLALAFSPEDLRAPVTPERAIELAGQVQSIVIDPSDFTDITLYSPTGTILYSTSQSLIGTQLPGERGRIMEALKGEAPQVRVSDGTVSVMVPMVLRSGVGEPAAIELIRPDDPVASAPGPWQTNALFLLAMLVLLAVAVFGVARVLAVVTDQQQQLQQQAAVKAPSPAGTPGRTLSPPLPGLREEGEARRRAEERARAAEERLTVLQEQYRKTLDDLQTYQAAPREPAVVADPKMEERALRAEGQLAALQQQLQTLTTERQQLARELELAMHGQQSDGDTELLLRAAEREASTLRAEVQAAREARHAAEQQLQEARAATGDPASLRHDLDQTNLELLQARDQLASAQGELDRSTRELDDARAELRALRNEEQRAAMLQDELRAAKAELESFRASHRADLVERESEFEEKVRATREEFQRQLEEMETSYRTQVDQKESELAGRIAAAEGIAHEATTQLEELRSELEAAKAEASSREQRLMQASDEMVGKRSEVAALEAEIKERTVAVQQARKEADDLRRSLVGLQADLARTDEAASTKDTELAEAVARAAEAEAALGATQQERVALLDRTEKLTAMLEGAAAENAELNRRLQEIESRRQLELADDEGRSEIDELLRVTQERLAGQTEKLMAAEDRVRDLESSLTDARDRAEIAEGELRTHQMSEALREIRDPEHVHEGHAAEAPPSIDDRRSTTPFVKELSMDARKSISRINGIAQLLKHKRDAKEQTQLLKQLASNMRRLDYAVADMADAEKLVRGTVEMQVRKTELEALVHRVVEESGIGADHEVRLITESVAVRVDAARVEQLLAGLLRNSAERTANGKQIIVRVGGSDGGAMLAVEDPETSSDASMSPVAKRLAELHGGWAKVEGREHGGSVFKVYLPDGGTPVAAANSEPEAEVPVQDVAPELQIVVDDVPEQKLEPTGEQILAQELRRLATEGPRATERSGRRSRSKR